MLVVCVLHTAHWGLVRLHAQRDRAAAYQDNASMAKLAMPRAQHSNTRMQSRGYFVKHVWKSKPAPLYALHSSDWIKRVLTHNVSAALCAVGCRHVMRLIASLSLPAAHEMHASSGIVSLFPSWIKQSIKCPGRKV